MVALGKDAGVNTVALLTNMSTPLGLTAGNAIEVEESVEVLAGGGPEDVVELTVRLAEEMLACAGVHDADPRAALKDGRAMDVWNRMIEAQGGDPRAKLPVAKESEVIYARPTVSWWGSMPWQWALRRGASARDVPARKTPSRPVQGSACMQSPVPRSVPASR
ncbi:thymidine phosphorylase [Arthrobacter sp. Hiyo4]|nr:thymidine phosphorylase [Arthrobacter sp. Hiyo4]